jgi:hypothetical protein
VSQSVHALRQAQDRVRQAHPERPGAYCKSIIGPLFLSADPLGQTWKGVDRELQSRLSIERRNME